MTRLLMSDRRACPLQMSQTPGLVGFVLLNMRRDAASHNAGHTQATLQQVLLQTMRELPEDYWIAMKLFYRDDLTPPEYEPKGFEKARPRSMRAYAILAVDSICPDTAAEME